MVLHPQNTIRYVRCTHMVTVTMHTGFSCSNRNEFAAQERQ